MLTKCGAADPDADKPSGTLTLKTTWRNHVHLIHTNLTVDVRIKIKNSKWQIFCWFVSKMSLKPWLSAFFCLPHSWEPHHYVASSLNEVVFTVRGRDERECDKRGEGRGTWTFQMSLPDLTQNSCHIALHTQPHKQSILQWSF